MTLREALDVAIGYLDDAEQRKAARVLTRFRNSGLGEIEKVADRLEQPRGGTGEPTFVDYIDNACAKRLRTAIDDVGGEK